MNHRANLSNLTWSTINDKRQRGKCCPDNFPQFELILGGLHSSELSPMVLASDDLFLLTSKTNLLGTVILAWQTLQ